MLPLFWYIEDTFHPVGVTVYRVVALFFSLFAYNYFVHELALESGMSFSCLKMILKKDRTDGLVASQENQSDQKRAS